MNANARPEALLVGEDEAVFFAQVFHALEVELYPVAGVEGWACRLAGLSRLLEEVLESSGGDDLQYAARPVAGVPEGVPLVAGLEDEGALFRDDDLVAELRAQTALQDVAVLVLVRVAMKWGGERSWGYWMFHQREPSTRLLAPDHEPDAEGAEIHDLPVGGPNNVRTPGACGVSIGRRVIHNPLP